MACGSRKKPLYFGGNPDHVTLGLGLKVKVKVKVKEKVHTLDIAPLRNESPPQKRSGMARVLKGSHSFTCTPTRSSAIGMSHTCQRPSQPQLVLIYRPRRDGRLSRSWCEVEIRTCNLPIANAALYHTATSARIIRCQGWLNYRLK